MRDAPEYDGRMASGEERSPLEEALARVGDRWTLLIVEALLSGPRRFNDLLEGLSGIAPTVLSQRLKALERDAVVIARPYSKKPPRSVYELTAPGHELAGALRMLAQWGARGSEHAGSARHGPCGTPLEARWFCPTCARIAEDDSDQEVRFL